MNIKQKRIIRKLVISNGCRYSDISKGFEMEDKFPYHLKQLVNKGYVNKRNNRYFITTRGMQCTSTFSEHTLKDKEYKSLMFIMVCKWEDKYLLHYPFHGLCSSKYYFLPCSSILYGESIEFGCNKFLVKNQIKGKCTYRSTAHHQFISSNDKIFFDDIILIFDIEVLEKPKDLKFWFTLEKIKQLKLITTDVQELIVNDNRRSFIELINRNNLIVYDEDL